LEAKNYDLYKVYEKYDFNKDKLLDISEFKRLMDKIENGLSEEEIKLCFRRFDLNNDGYISF
jgi:Ca2+-binding EF-hand superfamily protein